MAVLLAAFFVASAITEQYPQGYGFLVGGITISALLFARGRNRETRGLRNATDAGDRGQCFLAKGGSRVP